MDTNEIKATEEVVEIPVETIEEAVKDSNNGLLIAVGVVGLAGVVGFITYKYAVKPLIAKAKAKKEANAEGEEPEEDIEVADYDEEDSE